MKTCSQCKLPKPLDAFNRASKSRDGHRSDCRECQKKSNHWHDANKERAKANRKRWHDANKESSEASAQEWRENNKEKDAASKKRWHDANKEKVTAYSKIADGIGQRRDRRKVQNKTRVAIRRGHLERQPCEVCGTTEDIHAHHDDYSKPLEVRWLCRTHHIEHHKNQPDTHEE
jgi:hypothetical protein